LLRNSNFGLCLKSQAGPAALPYHQMLNSTLGSCATEKETRMMMKHDVIHRSFLHLNYLAPYGQSNSC